MSKKIKVGLLPLYIKLYDDNSGPARRAPMEQYIRGCIQMLETMNIEVLPATQVCRIAPEFEAEVVRFTEADVDAVITVHLAYSPSLESIQALLKLDVPIIVLDATYHYEIIEASGYEKRTGHNHGIHGVQDMCNLLKQNGRPYFICAGHALHSEVISQVAGMCRAAAAAKAYRNMKVGSVGGSFRGMGDFLIPDERYKADIGAEVFYMTPEVAAAYLDQVTEAEIDAEIASDAAKYHVEVTWQDEYRLATKSGLALRKWMADNDLGAVTVNFLTLDISGLPKMPFPECCKVLERGQGYAGEGDALTAGLVGALFASYPNTTFTEMFCPDWKENVILMSHMGESNPNLAQWKPYLRNKKFTFNSCGNTVGIATCARPGKATIVNLAPMQDTFSLILCPGQMLDVGLERGAYKASTQGWFQPAKPLNKFLKEYSLAGGTHHSAMVYDADIEELKAFGEMLGFDVIVIE